MNTLVIGLRPSSGLALRLSARTITYEVSPTGEKIVLNKLEKSHSKKEKWQRIRAMGYEQELRDIKRIELNERQESDPMVARKTASSKLKSLNDSLKSRGFCRETKPYNPPQNVNNIIENIARNVFPNQTKGQNWSDIALNDRLQKFKFLIQCSKELNYEIPNSILYQMKSVSDVLRFYSTPIRGVSSYEHMVQNSDQLPQNLHVIGEPLLYKEESDNYFGGINAYPFSTYIIRGLRAKKKYPNFKRPFVWPDV